MPSDLLVVRTGGWVRYANTIITIPGPDPTDTYVLGVTEPNISNMGAGLPFLPAVSGVINGNMTITTPGFVLENTIVYGIIKVKAANVTFRNVIVVGPAGANQELYLIQNFSTGLVLEFITLVPRSPSSYINGLGPRDFTARRILIMKVVDGIRVSPVVAGQNVNVLVEGALICEFAFFYPDIATPSHTDGTHNDGVQIEGGNGAIFRGVKIESYFSTEVGDVGSIPRPQSLSGFMLNQTPRGNITNLLIELCIFSGSIMQINAGSLSSGGNSGTIQNNQFHDDMDPGFGNWMIGLDAAATAVTTTGNTIYGTGTAARITRSA